MRCSAKCAISELAEKDVCIADALSLSAVAELLIILVSFFTFLTFFYFNLYVF